MRCYRSEPFYCFFRKNRLLKHFVFSLCFAFYQACTPESPSDFKLLVSFGFLWFVDDAVSLFIFLFSLC